VAEAGCIFSLESLFVHSRFVSSKANVAFMDNRGWVLRIDGSATSVATLQNCVFGKSAFEEDFPELLVDEIFRSEPCCANPDIFRRFVSGENGSFDKVVGERDEVECF
jgi:hypothetical protein